MSTHYADMAEVAGWLGVTPTTLAAWRHRYHDTPAEDITLGRSPGWSTGRRVEWIAWEATRPGQGTGGGRPRKH